MRTAMAWLSLVGFCLIPVAAFAQIVPPAPGVEMPQAYFDRIAEDKKAFQFQHAWIEKARLAKENRLKMLAAGQLDGLNRAALPDHIRRSIAVTSNVFVPVFLIDYTNRPAPYAASALQAKLFSGPNPTGTMSQLYAEMSYGNVNLTGTVYNWVSGTGTDAYYEGGCNGLCGAAKTGQLILEVLQGNDAAVDFGIYDNDGPDGVANSGDDDGFVDFIAVVHPEIGGECGTSNIWSHRWVVQGWPEFPGPWVTNDPRSGGGFIQVSDYTIQPALGSGTGCGGGTIEIGVFCHEFGHAFGLPDLYDTSGVSEGVGEWGLMGSGSWNTSANPAHMCAWSKIELGWIIPTEVALNTSTNINDVELNAEAYKLNIIEDKFHRSLVNPIAGTASLKCELHPLWAAARNWPGGKGYGNAWHERIYKDFTYDGSTPITLTYDYSYDTESAYDFAYVKIEVNSVETTLRTYTGVGSGTDVVDLTPVLGGSGASSYTLILQFDSDASYSDEDGNYNSGAGGPFLVDNMTLVGGGENYTADFEQYEDGWHTDFSKEPSNEYFLVENRHKTGQFDQALHSEGLGLWHIEENVINWARFFNDVNAGGPFNNSPRGVMLEEADGLNHLLNGSNRGDAGDVYPGSSNNTLFQSNTNPNSKSYNNLNTWVRIANISAAAPTMTATMRGGFFPPLMSSIMPDSGVANTVVSITDLLGSRFVHGATFLLRDASLNEYPATNVEWIGKAKLTGSLNLAGVPEGFYDVIIRNPDGQQAVLSNGFEVMGPIAVFIQNFDAKTVEGGIELSWWIDADEALKGFQISRQNTASGASDIIGDGGTYISPDRRSYIDRDVGAETTYRYSLIVVTADGEEIQSFPVTARSRGYVQALYQNHPNPFNPVTTIRYSIKERGRVTLQIFNTAGQLVRTLVNDVQSPRAGGFSVQWDGRNGQGHRVASGVYLYKLTAAGEFRDVKKMVVLK